MHSGYPRVRYNTPRIPKVWYMHPVVYPNVWYMHPVVYPRVRLYTPWDTLG